MHTTDSTSTELVNWLNAGQMDSVDRALDALAVQDIADTLAQIDGIDDRLTLFEQLPDERQTDTFSYLGDRQQLDLINALPATVARRILHELLPDDRTAFLESLPPETLESHLKLLAPEDLTQSLRLLGYPEESIGRLMTPRFVAVQSGWTVARALDHIRHEADRGETVNFIFVTDKQGHLLDAIRLKDFILARQDKAVETLMDGEFYSVLASADQEEAVQVIQRYDLSTLAVTDKQGVLIGIVTVDDIMDVAEEEITEDFQKLGAAGVLNVSLKEASAGLLYQKRVGWLLVLVVMNLIGGAAIAMFEQTIEATLLLVFFLPLVIGTGGNAGAQAATLMVRALATGDVQLKDWFKLWGKELSVAALLGLSLAAVVAGVGFYRGGTDIAIIIAISMIAVVIFGSMMGMVMPFILTRFKLDPATASVPLITSIADIGGILIYLTTASLLLSPG